jgi:1-acyl-sn-glycerol-3-phosphate acyltransferase
MFPEGKRSNNGGLIPAHHGSAMIAFHNRVKILPIGIIGSEKIHGFTWMWKRPQITLNIGRTFSLPDCGKTLTKTQLAESTNMMMQQIAELLPENYRGIYRGAMSIDVQKN